MCCSNSSSKLDASALLERLTTVETALRLSKEENARLMADMSARSKENKIRIDVAALDDVDNESLSTVQDGTQCVILHNLYFVREEDVLIQYIFTYN